MANQRMSQVNELLRSKINEFMTKDLEVPSDYFITLSRVDTAPNLRNARVYISVIPDNKRGSALRLLKKSHGRLQKYVGSHIAMKFTPKFQFVIDDQLVYGNEIDILLSGIDFSQHIEQDIDENLTGE